MTYDEITLGQWLLMEEAAKDYDNDYYQAAAKISVLSGHDVDDLISMPLNKYGKIQSKYDFLMYPPRTIMATTFEGKPFNLDFKTLPYGDFVDLMEIIKTTPERIDLIIAKLWQSGMTLEASAKVIREKMTVPLAMGLSAFFFRLLGTLTTTHPAIFKQEDTQDGEGIEDTFIKSFGWILWIDKIANNEPLKWHEVEAMTTYRALNVMTYIIARDEYDKRQSKVKRYE